MTVTDDLRVRSRPEVSDASTKYEPTLFWGTRVAVEDGPVAGSGYWWCRVGLIDQTLQGGVDSGWVAVAAKEGDPWLIAGEAGILQALRQRIVGSWAGTVRTEWVDPYRVSLTFRADGTYSAHAEGDGQTPALYWGSDTDSPSKTYSIRDVAADGTASGDIVLYWDNSETNVVDELGDIAFQGDRLTLTLTHFGQYGPIAFDLTRAKAS